MKKIVLFLMIALMLSSCLKSLEKEGVFDTITYTGTLLDSVSMQPIAGVNIQITDEKRVLSQINTDENGYFYLDISVDKVTSEDYIKIGGSIVGKYFYPSKKGKLVGFGLQEYDFSNIFLGRKEMLSKPSVEMISEGTFRLSGAIYGNVVCEEVGFVYNDHFYYPTIEDSEYVRVENNSSTTFEATISGVDFQPDEKLYVRSYVRVGYDVIYSEITEVSHPYWDLPTFIHSGETYRVYPSIEGEMVWNQAMSTCENLTYGGYSDWVLPSKNVLNTMYLYKNEIGGFFCDYYTSYWSSTEYSSNVNYAWHQSFYDADQDYDGKGYTYYVRCVRRGN